MKLDTFINGTIVGAASGFICGYSFFWVCPVDFPYWGALIGAPIGGLLFCLAPMRALRWIVALIWIPSLIAIAVGLILSQIALNQ